MKYNSDKIYAIGYYDPKMDDYIQVHTDSLATAIIALITRSRRYPNRRIDLTYSENDKVLGLYEDGKYRWQSILKDPDWQQYISHKLKIKNVTPQM